jgi:hypothetical protein
MTDSFHAVEWETFVVRVWREAASGAWRGEIVHVPDRAAIHFASFAQAEEFVRRYVPDVESDYPSSEIKS